VCVNVLGKLTYNWIERGHRDKQELIRYHDYLDTVYLFYT